MCRSNISSRSTPHSFNNFKTIFWSIIQSSWFLWSLYINVSTFPFIRHLFYQEDNLIYFTNTFCVYVGLLWTFLQKKKIHVDISRYSDIDIWWQILLVLLLALWILSTPKMHLWASQSAGKKWKSHVSHWILQCAVNSISRLAKEEDWVQVC